MLSFKVNDAEPAVIYREVGECWAYPVFTTKSADKYATTASRGDYKRGADAARRWHIAMISISVTVVSWAKRGRNSN